MAESFFLLYNIRECFVYFFLDTKFSFECVHFWLCATFCLQIQTWNIHHWCQSHCFLCSMLKKTLPLSNYTDTFSKMLFCCQSHCVFKYFNESIYCSVLKAFLSSVFYGALLLQSLNRVDKLIGCLTREMDSCCGPVLSVWDLLKK